MKAFRLAVLALACSAPLLAAAQWQWVDKDGRKVFSDQAPPADVPPNRILKQPGGRPAAAAPAEAAPGADGAATTAAAKPEVAVPKVSGKEKELEARKKQADAAEAEKLKAEEAKLAALRTENCSRAKASKSGFDSGMRIAHTNAQGEREVLDDKQREVEVKRLDQVIARDCPKRQ
jgi:hypothetical protein